MTLRPLFRWTAPAWLLFGLVLTAGPATAADKWTVSRTTAPATVEELKVLQDTVRKVVEKCTPATVGLMVPAGDGYAAGSGVIISEDGLILTVGHVTNYKPGVKIDIYLHDGKKVKAETLGFNKKRDTGMAKITAKGPNEGKWPFLKLGKSGDLKEGQWVVTLGHPGGRKEGRPPVVRLGQIREVDLENHLIKSNCMLVGGDSGGPLFDLNGDVVGIHDRIGFTLDNNIHLPIESFQDQWDRLVKGEAILKDGPKSAGATAVFGVTFDTAKEAGAKIDEVQEDGPAADAGLKAGDVILEFDGVKVGSADDVRAILAKKKPGEEIEVTIKRGTKTLVKTVTLGKRDS